MPKRIHTILLALTLLTTIFTQPALAANRASIFSVQNILHQFQNGMTAKQVEEMMSDPIAHTEEGALIFFDQPETDATMMAKFEGDTITNLVFRWPYVSGDVSSLWNGYRALRLEMIEYFEREPDIQREKYENGVESKEQFLDGSAAWRNAYGGNAIILATRNGNLLELSLMCSGFAPPKTSTEAPPVPPLRNLTNEEVATLSLDELLALKNQLNLAIWRATEWKEITVQQGIWKIGEDIPAGHWTIQASDGAYTLLQWCGKLNAEGTAMDVDTLIGTASLVSTHSEMFDSTMHRSAIDWNLKDGTYIIVSSGNAVFIPYRGNTDFEFKN